MTLIKAYNGWIASKNPADFGGLDNRVVPGTIGAKFVPGVRAGAFAEVFFYFMSQFDKRVEKLDLYTGGDEWGFYFKASANSAALLSVHSAGGAGDANATRHPNNKRGTFSAAQVAEIRKIQAEVDGLIYWGGDAWGNGTPDEMHFEAKTGSTISDFERVATKLRMGGGASYPVIGNIKKTYDRVNGPMLLGAPVIAEAVTSGSDPAGRFQSFQHGMIFFHPAVDGGTAHEVHGGILEKWNTLGREAKPNGTGFPTTDEGTCPDKIGRFNHFTGLDGLGASLYWSPATGAHLVKGLIRKVYSEQGWEKGFGYPTTDEMICPDKVGRYNHFSADPVTKLERSIYHHPQLGTWPVVGMIRKAWCDQGWEAGKLGYPVDAEHDGPHGREQTFQGGRVIFASGVAEVALTKGV